MPSDATATAGFSTSPNGFSQATTRLYISPLDESVLTAILPSSVRPLLGEPSYHTIQTFPEKSYGFFDLPTAEAVKLKQKLNGAILKGRKMSVEEARPEKGRKQAWHNNEDVQMASESSGMKQESSRRRSKRDAPRMNVTEGIELPEHRRVQRGWTDSDAASKKKRKNNSRGTNAVSGDSKLIFRSGAKSTATPVGRVDGQTRANERKASSRTTEVKEFSKTTKFPGFLRDTRTSSGEKRATSFVDGQGWVDEKGDLVEAVPSSEDRKGKAATTGTEVTVSEDVASPDSSDNPADSSNSSVEDSDASSAPFGEKISKQDSGLDQSISASPVENAEQTPLEHPSSANTTTSKSPEASKAVHPLEALFKRPVLRSSSARNGAPAPKPSSRPAPIKTSFSFFDHGDEIPSDDTPGTGATMPPQTPFTQRDLEGRSIRSAAPTPDTAAIGKRFFMPWASGKDRTSSNGLDDSDSGEGEDVAQNDADADAGAADEELRSAEKVVGSGNDHEQTEFEKHFWAKRGEYNRAWKARKREARKEVRQGENKRRRRA